MSKVVVFALLIFHCLFVRGQTDRFIKTIEKVNLSIVPVACASYPDKDSVVAVSEIEGTGFFVNFNGDFITAAHVITEHFKWNKKGEPSLTCFPVIYVPNPTWSKAQWFQFDACNTDSTADIAVCKTALNPFSKPELHISRLHINTRVPEDGTPIAFTGFPQLILVPITSRANVAASGAFFESSQKDIVIDKTAWHGVSGAPLYLEDGSVVGIVTKSGDGLWSGMAFARQASSFITFLTEKKITVWQEDEEQTKQKPKK